MQITVLKQSKAAIKVFIKYLDFLNVFSEKKALLLLEQIKFNQHAIKLD